MWRQLSSVKWDTSTQTKQKTIWTKAWGYYTLNDHLNTNIQICTIRQRKNKVVERIAPFTYKMVTI